MVVSKAGVPSAAEFYSALHTGTPGDSAFYRARVEGAASVLELGCGDGRLLSELGQAGRHLVGLDHAPDMLSMAKERLLTLHTEVELTCADMRTFELNERFERIILPFNGMFCLRGGADKLSCLQRCHSHLAPGGSLLFDIYPTAVLDDDSELVEAEPEVDPFEELKSIECGGRRYTVFERNRWWPSKRELAVDYQYRVENDAAETLVEASILHSYCDTLTLLSLAEQAGFRVETGTFSLDADDTAPQIWIEASVR